jgi:hypothetical protein
LRRFWEFYETFDESWLERLTDVYALDFVFVDPFTEINDHGKLKAHFAKLLRVHYNRFFVEDAARGADGAYLRWVWEWQWKKKHPVKRVPGVTHIRHDANGKVVFHRDVFDAAEGFYEVIPVVGGILRMIKKRV